MRATFGECRSGSRGHGFQRKGAERPLLVKSERPAYALRNDDMDCYPKNVDDLNEFLDTAVSPQVARRTLAAIFACLYGTEEGDGQRSFLAEKQWDTHVLCDVADELATIGLYCDQPERDEA